MDAKTRVLIQDDDVSLREVARLLQRRRWSVTVVILACGGLAALAAWLIPNTYRATIVVAAATNTPGAGQAGGLGAVASQFSSLASLAGVAMGSDSHRAETVEVLESEALIEDYIRDNNLLPVLYAKQWDASTKHWQASWLEPIPTVWKAAQRFKHNIADVTTDTKSGLVTLTVTWHDAGQAAKWANDLVTKTNDRLRAKALAESERSISYLKVEAAKTAEMGVKNAIYAVLQSEISKATLARGSDEYALKVLDPAVAPEWPHSPQPLMWIAIGLFGGMLSCLTWAFVSVAWSKAS